MYFLTLFSDSPFHSVCMHIWIATYRWLRKFNRRRSSLNVPINPLLIIFFNTPGTIYWDQAFRFDVVVALSNISSGFCNISKTLYLNEILLRFGDYLLHLHISLSWHSSIQVLWNCLGHRLGTIGFCWFAFIDQRRGKVGLLVSLWNSAAASATEVAVKFHSRVDYL